MIIDVTGIPLMPGNGGKDCVGNGGYFDLSGQKIECCCEECDYLYCCTMMRDNEDCCICNDNHCPNAGKK